MVEDGSFLRGRGSPATGGAHMKAGWPSSLDRHHLRDRRPEENYPSVSPLGFPIGAFGRATASPCVSSSAALTWISKAAQHLFLEKKKKKPTASSEVMRVTGLQLSPVPQHLVYCENGADSSELFVWGAEAPHLCSEHLTQTDSCGNGLGLERGWRGYITSSHLISPLLRLWERAEGHATCCHS